MTARINILFLIAALGAMLALAGCGGDDSSTGTSASNASEAAGEETGQTDGSSPEGSSSNESTGSGGRASTQGGGGTFVSEGNAACDESRREMTTKVQPILATDSGKNADVLADKVVTNVVVPGFEGEIRALQELEPSGGDEEALNAVVAALEDLVAEAKASPTDFVGDSEPFEGTSAVARRYGLTSCGHL